MDLDAINRRITAIENRQHVNYSSISGTSYQLSYNGNNIIINSDGTITSNTVIIAIENKQHVNYSSISGTSYQLSYNGTNLIINSDGTITS